MRLAPFLLFALAIAPGTATGEPDHRVPPTGEDRPIHHGWFQLATPTPTAYGTEYIDVEEDTWLRMLRIQRATGTVVVRQVRVITYGKQPRVKVIDIDAHLDQRKENAFVDLGYAVRVDQIAITCDKKSAGTYVVYGSAAMTREDVASR
ncbi:MAG: hypothetical protein JO257_28695 [Deltaproteobacteria bacterium]|nr:hypothetical protein [Deltaproteobacteria bacterium]